MKKFAFLLLVAIVALTSCKKESTTTPTITESDLVGTWKITQYKAVGSQESTVGTQTIGSTWVTLGKEMTGTVAFTKDPNKYTTSGSYDFETTQKVGTQTIVTNTTSPDSTITGTWTLNDDILILDDGTTKGAMDILELTSDKLRLKAKVDTTITVAGYTTSSSQVVNTTYIKQ